MKKSILLVFTLYISVLLSAVSHNVSFNIADLELSQEDRGYDVIRMNELEATIKRGEPELPIKYINLIIPCGMEVDDINITTQQQNIEGSFTVNPSAGPILPPSEIPEPAEPNPAIYNSSNIYPLECVEIISHGYFDGGNRIVSLAVYPVQYIPQDSILKFNDNIYFSLSFKSSDQPTTLPHYRLAKYDEIYDKSLRSIVENDCDVSTYKYQPTILTDPREGDVEMYIIGDSDYASDFTDFISWKRMKGLTIEYRSTEAIHATYPFGDNWDGHNIADMAGSIRAFLRDVYSDSLTVYALIVGGSTDFDSIPSPDDVNIPVRYACHNHDTWLKGGLGWAPHNNFYRIPTDMYFSDFGGDYDLEGDIDNYYGETAGIDNYGVYRPADPISNQPEVYVGRLILSEQEDIDNHDQIRIWTEKLITYETNPGYGDFDYLGKTVLFDGFISETGSNLWYNHTFDYLLNANFNIYEYIEPTHSPAFPTGDWVIDKMNEGFGLSHFYNHGSKFGTYNTSDTTSAVSVLSFDYYDDYYEPYPNNGFENLIHNGKYSVSYSVACNPGSYDKSQGTSNPNEEYWGNYICMAEAFTTYFDKVGGPEGIDIWDLGRPNNHISFSNYYAYDFVTDYQNQRVLAISGFTNPYFTNPGGNNILILSGFDDPISYTIPNNRNEFAYDIDNEKIYFVGLIENNEYLYSLDILTGQYTSIFSTENELLAYIQYSYEQNELYVSSIDKSFEYCKLYIFDLEETVLIETIDLPMLSTQTFYNDYSNKLYILNLHDWSEDFEMNMFSVEVENNNTLTKLPLTFKERPKGGSNISLWGFKGCKSILPYNDRLFVVRGNNVLQEIVCFPTETKTLSSGWNWESFPRLERDETVNEAVDVVPILGTIEPFDMNYIEFFKKLDYLYYEDEVWDPLSHDIQSTWFYKIFIEPEAERTLELYGTRMEADYELEDLLEAGEYNWLGFWLPGTQNMIESFGEYWQYVDKVKSEEWFYSPANNQRGGDPTYPTVLSAENLTLSYGKGYMVLFKDLPQPITDFHWTVSAIVEEPEKKAEPENFTYTEKADYEAIDVFNIPPNVIEIGVFEDEVCVGAVVVEDTCAQILVYSDYANRDPIPFTLEVVTGRGFSTPIKDYKVMNMETGKYESKSIISGRQEYSVLRFDYEEEPEENTLSTPQLHGNHPNPFNPTTTISFSLPNEQDIEFTIYNIKGQKVKTLYSGIVEEGKHSMIWDGKDTNDKTVCTGIYFYKLKTGNQVLIRKMLMLK